MRTAFTGYMAGHEFQMSSVTRGASGFYLGTFANVGSNVTLPSGVVYYTYLALNVPALLLRLGINLNAAGTDPSYMGRFGLFKNGRDGAPGALIVDGGQAPIGTGTPAPAAVEVTIPGLPLEPGGYWCAFMVTGAGGSAPSVSDITNAAIPELGCVAPDTNLNIGWSQPGQTGFMPYPTGLLRNPVAYGACCAKFASAWMG